MIRYFNYSDRFLLLHDFDECSMICREIGSIPNNITFVPDCLTHNKIYPKELLDKKNKLWHEGINKLKEAIVKSWYIEPSKADAIFSESRKREISEIETELEEKKDYSFAKKAILNMFEVYTYKTRKYPEYYYIGNRPVMYDNSVVYDNQFRPIPSIIADCIYSDIEELLTKIIGEINAEIISRKRRNDKREVDKVITITFFRTSKIQEIHTVRYVGSKPFMYDIIPYLRRSECLGHTNEFPYNSVIFKSFDNKRIMQVVKKV